MRRAVPPTCGLRVSRAAQRVVDALMRNDLMKRRQRRRCRQRPSQKLSPAELERALFVLV